MTFSQPCLRCKQLVAIGEPFLLQAALETHIVHAVHVTCVFPEAKP